MPPPSTSTSKREGIGNTSMGGNDRWGMSGKCFFVFLKRQMDIERETTQTKKNSTWTIQEEEKTNANVDIKIKKKKLTHTHSNKRVTEIF